MEITAEGRWLRVKAKKLVMTSLATVLLLSLVVTPALADPARGRIVENPRKHIVRNSVFSDIGTWTQVAGWVTFACQSVEGFQYSVAVKGLAPGTTYDVRAEALFVVDPDGPGPIPPTPTSDGGSVYALGSITANGEGEGEVEGLITLPASHPFLPFGMYGWEIVVSDGVDVLRTAPFDPIDFQVFPSWP